VLWTVYPIVTLGANIYYAPVCSQLGE